VHEANEPEPRRFGFRHWLIVAASLLAAFVIPFLVVLCLDRR
jgi:hypothetical protein